MLCYFLVSYLPTCSLSFFGLNDPVDLKKGFLIKVFCAVFIGVITHLFWDGLTHSDSRTLLFSDFLAQSIQIGSITTSVHTLMQVLSSILPLPIICLMIYKYFKQYKIKKTYTQPLILSVFALGVCFVLLSLGNNIVEIWTNPNYLLFAFAVQDFMKSELIINVLCFVYILFIFKKG